jgi:hypothetical protein
LLFLMLWCGAEFCVQRGLLALRSDDFKTAEQYFGHLTAQLPPAVSVPILCNLGMCSTMVSLV